VKALARAIAKIRSTNLLEVRTRENSKLATLHCPARSPGQAARKASKGRQVVGVRKLQLGKLFGDIEKLELGQGQGLDLGGGIYEGDIDIDSILGFSKNSRRKRRSESERRKQQTQEN